ncbi:MAG: hypothetical protein KGR47_02870, partial [Acidobacteria bacterium]|nr:hypothetical protein [Acidobacteriota bacterium]
PFTYSENQLSAHTCAVNVTGEVSVVAPTVVDGSVELARTVVIWGAAGAVVSAGEADESLQATRSSENAAALRPTVREIMQASFVW